jgi:DNA-binding NarL/FixJ family response regulator
MLIESRVLAARLALTLGEAERAEALTRETPERIEPKGAYGEYLAHRALSLACTGRWEAAVDAAEQARAATITLEARTLASLSDAVVELSTNEGSRQAAVDAWNVVVAGGHYDLLVGAYRAYPALAQVLWADVELRPALRSLLHRAQDSLLATDLSGDHQGDEGLKALSAREREVLELIAEGLSNKQIADKLFISLSTVKVHVRHVLEKLEAKTRTEAALRWVAEREAAMRRPLLD